MFFTGDGSASEGNILALGNAANSALRGETHNTGTMAVPAGETAVTIRDRRCGVGKLAFLIPLDAIAATLNWHLSGMTTNAMSFTFSTAPESPCAFGFVIIGAGKITR